MGLLQGSTVYLAGAIEHENSPTSWRERIKRELLWPLGIKVYDPLVKPSFMSALAKGSPVEYRSMLKADPGREIVWPALAEIRDIDRQFAYACDFMICNMPLKFTVGTFEELTIAASCNKPVLVFSPDGIISTWLPPMLARSSTEFFDHVHFGQLYQLHEYVQQVDAGIAKVDKLKWIFLTYFNDCDIKAHVEKNK